MAFLDNSGDIILDAVLTDAGRARLAKGDGSFKIAKFAFGDDEIDYSSYNASHASGSAYYDLEILQTPVFEAFTNNMSTMKSKLVSLTNNNLLYLPIIKLNTVGTSFAPTDASNQFGSGSHVVLVDSTTITAVKAPIADGGIKTGVIPGLIGSADNNHIRVDQGLDTNEISPALILDPELKETQYIVELDSRFGKLYDVSNADAAGSVAAPSYIDDDLIASYYFTSNVGSYVKDSKPGVATGAEADNGAQANFETINGPRGTNLRFGVLAATDLVTSTYLFTTIGSAMTANDNNGYYYIDSTIRISGVTTGYKIDIPIRFLKKQ